MIKIDKGVPLPEKSLGRQRKYPIDEMIVGDSFFAPGVKISSMVGNLYKKRPKTFTVRTRVEGGVSGVRVWRIE